MEKKDFPKGTKPREIFVYTCERIAEPLIPLGYKYRKSKNDIYKKDGIFVFSFYFSPSIRFGSTTFTAFFDVSSPVIAQWRSEQQGPEEAYDGIVGTSIARLTRRGTLHPGDFGTDSGLCPALLRPVFRLAEAAGRCGAGGVLSPSEGVRCPKAESGVHRMLSGVSPKEVIEWAIILSNQSEVLEVYYGTVFEEKGRNAG